MATPPPPPPAADPNTFYGYLYQEDKGPTKVFDALLRAVAHHIIDHVGDRNERCLTPKKLSAFYHAVGGNYDALFLQAPNQSISYIWQVTGCQHTLQPTEDDFTAPSVPALTLKGFVRWQSIETLLCPEEHAQYLQYATKNWALKDLETGEPFPHDLPREAFPPEPDADVDRWHKQCAEKLRQEATPKEDAQAQQQQQQQQQQPPPEIRVKDIYNHVRAPPGPGAGYVPRPRPLSPRASRPDPDYFRSVAFNHVPGHSSGPSRYVNFGGPYPPERPRRGSPPPEPRRRSFSEYPSPDQDAPSPQIHLDSVRGMPPRRHSHPHRRSLSSGEESPTSPRVRRTLRRPLSNESPGSKSRRVPPAAPEAPDAAPISVSPGLIIPPPVGSDRRRREVRGEDGRRRRSSNLAGFREKVTSFLPSGLRREASPDSSRGHAPPPHAQNPGGRHSRESIHSSRLSRGWSYDSDEGDTTESDRERDSSSKRRRNREMTDSDRSSGRRRPNSDRERNEFKDAQRDRDARYNSNSRGQDKHRERERERDRDWDRDRDRDRERERERDGERQPRDRDWDDEREHRSRRDRERERERYLSRPEVYRRTSSHADIDREEMRQREQRRWEGRKRMPSPGITTGVGGRRYPTVETRE